MGGSSSKAEKKDGEKDKNVDPTDEEQMAIKALDEIQRIRFIAEEFKAHYKVPNIKRPENKGNVNKKQVSQGSLNTNTKINTKPLTKNSLLIKKNTETNTNTKINTKTETNTKPLTENSLLIQKNNRLKNIYNNKSKNNKRKISGKTFVQNKTVDGLKKIHLKSIEKKKLTNSVPSLNSVPGLNSATKGITKSVPGLNSAIKGNIKNAVKNGAKGGLLGPAAMIGAKIINKK